MSASAREAWRQLCEAMATLPELVIERDGAPASALDVAEGYRYLARQVRIALEDYVEYRDPRNPRFYLFTTPTRKTGIDNPDTIYLTTPVSAEHTYRVHGNVGTIAYVGFGLYAGFYGSSTGLSTVGHFNADDFHIEPDGSFEIVLSATPHPGNWIELTPETRRFDVRQTYLDAATEQPATVSIELLDIERRALVDPAQVLVGLTEAAEYIGRGLPMWADFVASLQEQTNTLIPVSHKEAADLLSNMDTFYASGYWTVSEDDALVVDLTLPPCRYWSFQIASHWMESFSDRTTVLNKHSVRTEDPTSVRIVLSSAELPAANVLRVEPYSCGTMTLRAIMAPHAPSFRVTRMPASDVGAPVVSRGTDDATT